MDKLSTEIKQLERIVAQEDEVISNSQTIILQAQETEKAIRSALDSMIKDAETKIKELVEQVKEQHQVISSAYEKRVAAYGIIEYLKKQLEEVQGNDPA